MSEEPFYPPTQEEVVKPVKKPRKKRVSKPMSDEKRARMLENLKKGRETSRKNRQAKAQAKKDRLIKGEELLTEMENKPLIAVKEEVKEVIHKKAPIPPPREVEYKEPNMPVRKDNGEIMNKLNELQSQINSLREEKRIRRIEKAEARKRIIEKERKRKKKEEQAPPPLPPPKEETAPIRIPERRSTFNRPLW
tara:strand:+ start:450 stop:1028 length:579 start_codon:yes stop_codon:yes gene_type:complete